MRLFEFVCVMPRDAFGDDDDEMLSHAIAYARDELAPDYCIPATWFAWVCGPENALGDVPVAVSRLTDGGPFPAPVVGYCYVGDTIEDLDECDIEVWSPKGLDAFVLSCNIDHPHIRYNVWKCVDGKYRARLEHMSTYDV